MSKNYTLYWKWMNFCTQKDYQEWNKKKLKDQAINDKRPNQE